MCVYWLNGTNKIQKNSNLPDPGSRTNSISIAWNMTIWKVSCYLLVQQVQSGSKSLKVSLLCRFLFPAPTLQATAELLHNLHRVISLRSKMKCNTSWTCCRSTRVFCQAIKKRSCRLSAGFSRGTFRHKFGKEKKRRIKASCRYCAR